jgi:hypothetical protein
MKILAILVSFATTSVLAQEPAATPVCVVDKRKEEKIKELRKIRDDSARRLEDRAAVPKVLDLAVIVAAGTANAGAGFGLAGAVTANPFLLLTGLGVGGCCFVSALTLSLVNGAAFDHRKADTEALVKAQEALEKESMPF